MSNLDKLIALKKRYGLWNEEKPMQGNIEISELIGYTYDGVNHWFRKPPQRLRTVILKSIERALALKYPDK